VKYHADANGAINIADRYLSGESHSREHRDGGDSAADGRRLTAPQDTHADAETQQGTRGTSASWNRRAALGLKSRGGIPASSGAGGGQSGPTVPCFSRRNAATGLILFPVLDTGSRRPEAVLNKYPVAESLPSLTSPNGWEAHPHPRDAPLITPAGRTALHPVHRYYSFVK